MKTDVYERITDRSLPSWSRASGRGSSRGTPSTPPAASPARCARTAFPISGINVLMLWSEAVAKGYAAPIWMTFKQALELGAHVRKGEHGSLVVYASSITRTETDADTGEESERDIPFMKGYTVFNVEQIEGLPAHYLCARQRRGSIPCSASSVPKRSLPRPARSISHGGNIAPITAVATDHVQMPPFEAFRDAESYYATLAHETDALDAAPLAP